MAEAQVEVCVACAQPVPIASNRRRFRSASSSHVLPTLSEIIRRIDPAASSAILDSQGPAFVCRGCFSSLKKLKKVRAEACQIDARLESGVRRFSELHVLEWSSTTTSHSQLAGLQKHLSRLKRPPPLASVQTSLSENQACARQKKRLQIYLSPWSFTCEK